MTKDRYICLKNSLTIVIPTLNEEQYIGGLLKDISEQSSASDIQIIVADAKSSDETIKICKSWSQSEGGPLNITIVAGGSPSEGRNAGLKLVQTDYVVFIDADVRLSSKRQLFDVWYKLSTANLLVGAKLYCPSNIISKAAHQLFNIVNHITSKYRPFAVGAFFATHTKVIRELGSWDTSLIHGEDWVLSGLYSSKNFTFSKHPVIIDDRRLKKTGYFGMFKLLLMSCIMGKSYMQKDHGYWN